MIDELKKKLILSVGTHKGNRRLSPVEVACGFNDLKMAGMSSSDIAKLVLFKDTSMVLKFLSLTKLNPKIHHLIDWGRQRGCSISFSTAVEMVKLDQSEQEIFCEMVLSNCLTKNETIQIVQIRNRAKKTIAECVEDVLRLRTRIVKKYCCVGVVLDSELKKTLSRSTQIERDKFFRMTLQENLKCGDDWGGHLGVGRFSIVGDAEFDKTIKKLEGGFEAHINALLVGNIGEFRN